MLRGNYNRTVVTLDSVTVGSPPTAVDRVAEELCGGRVEQSTVYMLTDHGKQYLLLSNSFIKVRRTDSFERSQSVRSGYGVSHYQNIRVEFFSVDPIAVGRIDFNDS